MLSLLIVIVAAPPLLYLPGWAISFALRSVASDVLERHYERVVISALWSGWLALLLAELGCFHLWLQITITLGLGL
ncbi:MAG: hypothetical protein HGA65_12855, partial [Oscillochloris sp.]|nr:hypothetical protein [Oscillochloris sp.]